jgi:hypothetical protein
MVSTVTTAVETATAAMCRKTRSRYANQRKNQQHD